MAFEQQYDVVVIGAGHAGVEAGLAAARMGASTLMLTLNLDAVAYMPCNPSVGGPAKASSFARLMLSVVKWLEILIKHTFK